MGEEAEILLVKYWRYFSCLFVAAALTGLAGCKPAKAPEAKLVVAADYEAFWLWAGVKPQAVLENAKTVYILEGEVRADGEQRLTSLRPATPKVTHTDIWMVVRVETLEWNDTTYTQLMDSLLRWRGKNRLVGLQIDFDADTRGLEDYADFLRDLRRRLPPQLKLSITGLLDWSVNGEPAGLRALAGTVDEIVLQTYQGRKTIPGYQQYLKKLDRLNIPFRIGLVQGGEWSPPPGLAENTDFKGYVIFLVNPRN